MPAKVVPRVLKPEEKDAVTELARSRTEPARLVDRARIVLAAERQSAGKIAAGLGGSRPPVYA